MVSGFAGEIRAAGRVSGIGVSRRSHPIEFWTIYGGYQKELDAIWDLRVANIKKFADNFDKMTDPVADELANTMLNIEGQRTALRKKYYAEYKTQMGARVAARFLQVEATIGAMMDIQIGTEIPIIK